MQYYFGGRFNPLTQLQPIRQSSVEIAFPMSVLMKTVAINLLIEFDMVLISRLRLILAQLQLNGLTWTLQYVSSQLNFFPFIFHLAATVELMMKRYLYFLRSYHVHFIIAICLVDYYFATFLRMEK